MARVGIIAAIICLAYICDCLVHGQREPIRPKLSESFSAEYTRSGLGTELRGSIYRNFEEGKQFQVEQLGAQNGVVNTLTRADLKTKYKYFEPFRFCSRTTDPDINIIQAWNWVEKAEYRGQKEFNKKKVNIWAYNDTQNKVYNEIGVSAKNANRPVFIFEESSESFEVTVFQTFRSSVASSTTFDIPEIQCFEE